jgi:soluble lytic murein transglycosylase-like protein
MRHHMKRLFSISLALIFITAGVVFADVLVLQTGKTLRIHSYRVEGANMEIEINDHSDMVIPVEWVREIRDEPDPPPAPPESVLTEATNGDFDFDSVFAEHVRSTSEKYEMDPRLVAAVMKVESNFNPRAVSKKGAQGLMQLMPDTSKLYRVRNPYDPKQNIEAGVKYLKRLLGRYNNKLELALAAYNSGEKTVDRYRGIPPFAETKQYVQKVLQLYHASL